LVAEVSQIAQTEEGYIYLAKDGESVNLFQLGLKSENIFRITDLIAPKKVSQFQLDNNKKQIVYEVQEGNKSDIYLVKTDGTNKIQLTLDGLSREPVIKPSGEDVAFRRASDGIYVIRIDKSSEKKILNFTESGETKIKLLLWR
jgi:Tol biopolymer transport system component